MVTTDKIEINSDDLNQTSSSNSYTYNSGCIYRLPCGLCKLTNTQCPNIWNTNPITNPPVWYSTTPTVTCGSLEK